MPESWNPLTERGDIVNMLQYLLTVLGEEGAEVAQATSKCIRFGLDDHHPDRERSDNESELLTEVYQFVAVLEMLQEYGPRPVRKLSEAEIELIKSEKKAKVKAFMRISEKNGCLEPEQNQI